MGIVQVQSGLGGRTAKPDRILGVKECKLFVGINWCDISRNVCSPGAAAVALCRGGLAGDLAGAGGSVLSRVRAHLLESITPLYISTHGQTIFISNFRSERFYALKIGVVNMLKLTAAVDLRLSFAADEIERCDVMLGVPPTLFFFVVAGAASKMKSSSH